MKVGDRVVCVDSITSGGFLSVSAEYIIHDIKSGYGAEPSLVDVVDDFGRISRGWSPRRFRPLIEEKNGSDIYDETPEIAEIRAANNDRAQV